MIDSKNGTAFLDKLAADSAKVQAADPALQAFPAPSNHSGGAKVVNAAATLLTVMLGVALSGAQRR